jgi:lysophospholipase L1-like esterase
MNRNSTTSLSFLPRLVVAALGFVLMLGSASASPHLHLAGDSTMADKSNKAPNLERGWGQMLREYLVDPASLSNYAMNGRSSKSFIDEGRWQKLLDGVHAGDFVIIQFGHNDQKEKAADRYAPAHGLYRENLLRFIKDVRAKGAEPILATSICRRRFDEAGHLVDTHGDYPVVVRELAAEQKVALLDMQVSTWQLFERLGPEGAKKLLMWVEPGKYPELPKGSKDDTHLNEEGGRIVAGLAVQEMRAKHLGVAALFKDGENASAPKTLVPATEP